MSREIVRMRIYGSISIIPYIISMNEQETLFQKILRREIPAEILYETEHVLAFLDINPNNSGHTLVIPKVHSRNILDIDPTSWSALTEAVRFLAPTIMQAVGATGINIMMNNEPTAGQIIFHTHIHLIPRFEGDGYEHWHGHPYTEGEMVKVAEKIRASLRGA
jgi:histidine triad (HIT) family protein